MKITDNHPKTTILRHEGKKTFNPLDVTNLALQLAKRPDGSIERELFTDCCQLAFDALALAQSQIASIQDNRTDVL